MTDRLTKQEAEARAAVISELSYDLHLDLERGSKVFRGEVTVAFSHAGGTTFLEWVGGSIERMEIDGIPAEPEWDGSRITLPGRLLGEHPEVRIVFERPFDHTGEGFHTFTDPEDGETYLYTQFEPYSAHRVFPCFDQPDLKAVFRVSVTAPDAWEVVTAGAEVDRHPAGEQMTRRVFAETGPFSPYLLAICAGPFHAVRDESGPVPMGIFCRRSLGEHLDAEPLFDLTRRGMAFYGEFFDEPYPFGKYDQIFVPEFNWGGMENVAAVTYTDSVVFRDPPTEDQLLRRAEYFMHELAHMWFGDLVTLRWWDDLWLNESFASFVAYLALERLGEPGIWQDFNFRMKLWAYREDQLPTTHHIADEVPSTDETFLNFDGISYGKGAAVLKQLVRTMGEPAFRAGMRTYIRRHRFGNAALADLLAALQGSSEVDLVHWAARWLKTAGVNTIGADFEVADGRVERFELRQSAPADHPVLRPHALEVALVGESGEVRALAAAIEAATGPVADAVGTAAPDFVFPNHGDHAFAKVRLDDASVAWARHGLGRLDEPLLRQQVWASLWEMVRDRELSSLDYLDLVERHLLGERNLTIVRMVTATVTGAIARFVPEERIDAERRRFVAVARKAIDAAPDGDPKVVWARALIGEAHGADDLRLAAGIVDVPPDGLAVDQDMRWAIAVRWAALGLPGADERLASERRRDPSDRGDRAMQTAAAARPDPAAKAETWKRLHEHGYESLQLAMAAASGFWRRSQRELVEPYVPRFFAALPSVFDEWEPEAARSYFERFFPRYRVDQDTRDRVAAVAAGDGLGPALRRKLAEAGDDLDRAIACRAFAAADLEPPAGAPREEPAPADPSAVDGGEIRPESTGA